MKKIITYLVLGGYGEIGRVTVHDLFESTRDRIIVAGHNKAAAQKFVKSFLSSRVSTAGIDVRDRKKLADLIKKCNVVINATQYIFNLDVMRACEMTRKPYLDLGGLYHMTKKQLKFHSRWKKKGLLAVLGCGSTPGITNVLAAYGTSLLDRVHEIHIRFADYDYDAARDSNKIHFTLPYSFPTLRDEFTKKAAVFKNGKLRFVKAITGKEIEYFPKPICKVKEYHTLHSELATFPESFKKNGLKECTFKVSFPEDFLQKVELLIKEKKQPPPVIQKKIPHDLEYVRVRMKGMHKGKSVSLILDCITKSKPRFRATAGAYDTGVPPSIIAQMIVNGKIGKKGVLPPEDCIEPEYFFRELRKRGIRIKILNSKH